MQVIVHCYSHHHLKAWKLYISNLSLPSYLSRQHQSHSHLESDLKKLNMTYLFPIDPVLLPYLHLLSQMRSKACCPSGLRQQIALQYQFGFKNPGIFFLYSYEIRQAYLLSFYLGFRYLFGSSNVFGRLIRRAHCFWNYCNPIGDQDLVP